ncbi:MAG: pilus assembly protein [Actinobacteria bacterium]|nr:pilus assembly protein [Actinomycetota bacterium]
MLNTVTRQSAVCKKPDRQRGGVTLEATIVFPVFLAFMLLIINFIRLGMVYLAVNHAVGETAKQIATHAYPLVYVKNGVDGLESKMGVSGIASLESDTARRLMASVKGDVSQEVLDKVMGEITSSKMQDYLPGGVIGREDIQIDVRMCNPWADEDTAYSFHGMALHKEDIAIAAHYRVRMFFPFAGAREISLSSMAVERAWVR